MLLTTWGDREQCEKGGLHDYANREWNGLLASYYYPRWKAFFARNEERGTRKEERDSKFEERGARNEAKIDWFDHFEWPFVTGNFDVVDQFLPENAPYAYASFTAEPEGDCVTIAKELYDKYFNAKNYVQPCNHP